MSSSYSELADYLARQTSHRITLSFAQLESLLGSPLPSAAQESWWWKNTPEMIHVPAGAWLSEGWQAEKADPAGGEVTFVRSEMQSDKDGPTWDPAKGSEE